MAKLDGDSRELCPGEVEHFWKEQDRKAKKSDFRITNERMVERKTAAGHKIVYKNIGGFRG